MVMSFSYCYQRLRIGDVVNLKIVRPKPQSNKNTNNEANKQKPTELRLSKLLMIAIK